MVEYNRYPAIDENNNFPPQVRQALFNSSEFGKTIQTIVNDRMVEATETINASAYPISGIGISDDWSALQAAADATKDGQRLLVPPGQYRVSKPITVSDKSIIIDGYGATLIASGNHGVLNLSGKYGTIHSVSSISEVTIPNGEVNTWATKVTLTSNPDLIRGDVVKVISDDVIEGARPGSDGLESRIGEFAIVDSTDGKNVYLMGHLRERYTTNIRLTKLENRTAKVRGLKVSASLATANTGLIGAVRMIAPSVEDVVVVRSGGIGVAFAGCYTYSCSNTSIINAVNNPGLGQYGYGIADSSSSHGRIWGLSARHVRHAYTDDSPRISANSNPDSYGRSYGNKVMDSVVEGASVTGWDTHHASENTQFINCEAINCYSGFALRGRRHKIRNGYVYGGKNALNIFTEAAGCESWGHDIDVFISEGTQETPISLYVNSHNGVLEPRSNSIKNLTISSPNYANSGIRLQNAVLELDGVKIVSPESLPDSAKLISGQNSIITGTDVILDLRQNISGSTIALFDLSAKTTIDLDRVTVRNVPESAARTQAIRNTQTDKVLLSNVVLDYNTSTSATTAAADILYDFLIRSNGGTSKTIQQAGSDISVRVRRSSAPQIVANIVPSGSTATLGALQSGRMEGQVLIINNLGSVNLVIPHGTTYKTEILGAANKTLGIKDSITLVWNGTAWVEINR